MGQNGRDTTDTHSTAEQHESLPVESEKVSPMSLDSTHRQERAPDPRRRLLIAGLATTPILLTLMNRSALAQDITCSALASVILGGSADILPGANLPKCNDNANGNANGN